MFDSSKIRTRTHLSRFYPSRQVGFTLVELIMTIVILGVLAAIAVPKLVNLSKDARIATVQAMEGALRSQIHLLQMKCMTSKNCYSKINETDQSSAPLTQEQLIADGFPSGQGIYRISMVYGIPRSGALADNILALFNVLSTGGSSLEGTIPGFNVAIASGGYDDGGIITFSKSDAPIPNNCKVVYTPGKWGQNGWIAPWDNKYGNANLSIVPIEKRYHIISTITGC